MDPLAPSATTPSTTTPPSTGSGGQTASASSKQAFQLALSAALNRANVLNGAGGTDDDDDGSSLTVGNSMGLAI